MAEDQARGTSTIKPVRRISTILPISCITSTLPVPVPVGRTITGTSSAHQSGRVSAPLLEEVANLLNGVDCSHVKLLRYVRRVRVGVMRKGAHLEPDGL